MWEGEKERKRKSDAGRERRNEGWKEYVSNTQHLLLYCIVSINLYSASCSAHQSEALPVRETQREETTHLPVALHLQATNSAPRRRHPTCLQPQALYIFKF